MLWLAFRNILRRPWRNFMTVAGLAMAVAVLACLSGFGHGYKRALETELNRMGVQLMLVPIGCPYDGAARVLKGKTLENSLPTSALDEVRRDPAVAIAAPILMAALARPQQGRTDMWAGIDESVLNLKPWWQAKAGARWFTGTNSVILGCDAAEVEMRSPGDLFYSPETDRVLQVAGILERSGTSDDSLFFVPLHTAQAMFGQEGRLTAVAIRLRDPALVTDASQRLQSILGAQVVTLTEMMGTFLNLVGAVRTLLVSIALVAVAVSVLTVFNTLLAAVMERTSELAVMRAVGASRFQVMQLMATESLLLTGAGSIAGILIALVMGHGVENLVNQYVPLAPTQNFLLLTPTTFFECAAIGAAVGVLGGLYPAWRAGRLHPAQALKAE